MSNHPVLRVISILILFDFSTWPCLAQTEETIMPPPPPALDTNLVAVIDGQNIPSEWFLHEFRSTFYRHLGESDVRQAVFDPFLKRLVLAAKARELGLDTNLAVRAEIERRIPAMRAYMEYQLAMAEIGILNAALVRELDLQQPVDTISDDAAAAYVASHMQRRPGDPGAWEKLAPRDQEQVKLRMSQEAVEQRLNPLIDKWTQEMTVTVNRAFIDTVPLPEMKGEPPPGLPAR